MKVGYIRVSTAEQNTARQEVALGEVGKLFIEKLSGKDMNRPQLKALMEFVREGDIVIVESYSRLARSTRDLLSIVEQLESKSVKFISLKENIDTSTPQGRLMLTIFAGLSQFERECTLQRQYEGIQIAKEQGKYKGRKPMALPDNYEDIMEIWRKGAITARKAMSLLNMNSTTFYRKANEVMGCSIKFGMTNLGNQKDKAEQSY